MKISVAILGLFDAVSGVVTKKAGLSFVDSTCDDAKVLGLADSWYYNWNWHPDAKGLDCSATPRAAEFAPMLWSCDTDCESGLPKDYWSLWLKHGAKYLLGYNEPDNANQANMTSRQAAEAWVSVQKIAAKFNPPLELVSPAMTHWSEDGTPWLDDFFSNCTEIPACDPSLIKYVAFHDYGGDADDILRKAKGSAKKYGRPIWLTEFSVGYAEHRPKQDAFLRKVLPLLEASDDVFRYAWYSTRNAPDVGPDAWVAESALLPYFNGPWHKRAKRTCDESELMWLSGKSWAPGTLAQCAAKVVNTAECSTPRTFTYENGGGRNCYCTTKKCTESRAQWQDKYELSEFTYTRFDQKVCTSEDDMLWLNNGAESSLDACKAMAELTGPCAHPTTIAYESGGNKNCYCARDSHCTKVKSDFLDLHVQQGAANATKLALTSTGSLYKSLSSSSLVV